ncbi:SRPBCC family protein [Streptomyces sp. NPDC058417]|uniref:SRPBCC family protein n=1 Tax=unclassified Streptomyces TaxID=2593676 RepID=UPI003663EE69
MEHEVRVPVPVQRLRAALADPARVARALPGFQQDAGTAPVAGRIKLRVGGHTITYRGTLAVTPRANGTYAVTGRATEARGTGTVELALTLTLREDADGTAVTCAGTASADGRIAELPPETTTAAAVRLLVRGVEHLASAPPADRDEARQHTGTPSDDPDHDEQARPAPAPAADEQAVPADDRDDSVEDAPPATGPLPDPTGPAPTGIFDTDIPPSGFDDVDDAHDVDDIDYADQAARTDPARQDADGPEGDEIGGTVPASPEGAEPPAEAAHARRTMIGRSAEEVDHAPPRGRYAPVPAPQTITRDNVLRWAAPAAALAVASAIVVGRALRRRH